MICIDEGTANLDSESERDIQLVLRQAFTDSTVILIAHRVTSLENTDRVIVMQDGKVLEDGPTKDMSLKKGSQFYAMLNDQQRTSKEVKPNTIDEELVLRTALDTNEKELISFKDIENK